MTATDPAPAPIPHQVLARAGEGPMPRYRIVSLVHLGDGHVLAAFDGRDTGEDVPDPTGLHQRRSLDGGRSWGPIEDIRPADREHRIWSTDPSYVHDPDSGRLFLFHTRAKDRGVWDAVVGTDDESRDVLSSALATSEDEGRSWDFTSLTAIASEPPIRAAFATSGVGVRLTRGPHAGRLLQPYAGWFPTDAESAGRTTADRAEEVRSFCLFSDDHGATWQRGESVGTDMDETTIAELSDGRVLLNSRHHHRRQGLRHLAVSADGGQSWQDLGTTDVFADPGNNAQLARRFPDAPADDPRSRELLFSNTAHATERRRGTLHRSRDDGETWQELLVFEPGPCEYSAVQALEDGAAGVLWEVGSEEIRFARLEADQLEG